MMFRKAFALFLLMMTTSLDKAISTEPMKVGFVAPLSGPFQRLGSQMRSGARAATQVLNIQLIEQDDACTPNGGQAAANALVAQKVKIVIGFTCLDSLNAALPILRDAGIVTLTTSVRANALSDNKAKSGFLVYRLAPREDMEVAALTSLLLPRWRTENFAIIDDGTVQARNTAEALRFAATEANLKPVFTDTFRPGLENQAALVRRLQKSGATHVFIGGDIEDALTISIAAKGEIEIAVGEAVDPETQRDGLGPILGVALPDFKLLSSAAKASIALQVQGIEPDNYALSAFAALEIAAKVAASSGTFASALAQNEFDTALGKISFDDKGDLNANPFKLVTLKNGVFQRIGQSQ